MHPLRRAIARIARLFAPEPHAAHGRAGRGRIRVAVTTLDAVIESTGVAGPLGLKIDTEGNELEVLKGLTKYWDTTRFVICEAGIRRRFFESYQFSERVSFLLGRGFLFYNFLNPAAANPRYYDILFVPRTSPLLD